MTPEIIAIVTVGVALAGVGCRARGRDPHFDSRGAAGHGAVGVAAGCACQAGPGGG